MLIWGEILYHYMITQLPHHTYLHLHKGSWWYHTQIVQPVVQGSKTLPPIPPNHTEGSKPPPSIVQGSQDLPPVLHLTPRFIPLWLVHFPPKVHTLRVLQSIVQLKALMLDFMRFHTAPQDHTIRCSTNHNAFYTKGSKDIPLVVPLQSKDLNKVLPLTPQNKCYKYLYVPVTILQNYFKHPL